ncbi:MAG: DUF222 domain-containing protein [Ilumatobacteraceae bacterium]
MGILIDDPRLEGFPLLRGADRDDVLMSVEAARRQSSAALLSMIDAVELTGSYTDDGHRNIVSWVTAILGTSRSEANALVSAARLIREHPPVGDALADGHIGLPHLDELARLHRNTRIRAVLADMPDLIDELIEDASLLSHKDFTIICERVARNADPDGTEADHDAARTERKLTSTRRGTAHRIVADGDAISGAVFDTVHARYVQAAFDTDWAAGKITHGDLMCAGLMPRTDRQRRYDAFMIMTRAAADALEHGTNGNGNGSTSRTSGRSGAPLVVIHCDPDTITDVIRNHSTTGYRYQPEPSSNAIHNRRAETSTGAPVSDNDLFIALLLGNVQRVIHDPDDGHIIDLGRKRRLYTGSARTAALAEHHQCCHPGCGITGLGLQLDHNTPWAALMGPTDQHNVRIRCRHHNRHKETLGHRTERHPHRRGAYQTFRADNTEIAPRTSPATTRRRKHPPDPTG